MAGQRPEVNWAGTELRERVIARAREAAEGGGGNVAFVFANARHPDFAEALLHGAVAAPAAAARTRLLTAPPLAAAAAQATAARWWG